MGTSFISVDTGSTVNTATISLTEDAVTKHIPRSIINNSAGTELATASNPIQVSLANTGTNGNAISVNATLNAETTKVIGTINLNKIMGEDALIDNGASGNGCLRVTIANNSTGKLASVSTVNTIIELVTVNTVNTLTTLVNCNTVNTLLAVVNTVNTLATNVVNSYALITASTDFGASVTTAGLYTPTAGKRYVITDIVCSVASAGALNLFDNTNTYATRICYLTLAANGGAVISYTKPFVSAATNNVLRYSTASGTSGSITVSMYETA